jgi:hypothetical protein
MISNRKKINRMIYDLTALTGCINNQMIISKKRES